MKRTYFAPKIVAAMVFLAVFFNMSLPAFAESDVSDTVSNVIFVNRAESFVFVPDSGDLFQNFKGVMPGDVLEQEIIVANDKSNTFQVKIYLRAEVPADTNIDFLDQLNLQVAGERAGVLSDAPASGAGSLGENVLLGSLKPGDTETLHVTLAVPIALADAFQNARGEVIWTFTAEEVPVAQVPVTGGSDAPVWLGFGLLLAGLFLFGLKQNRRRRHEC